MLKKILSFISVLMLGSCLSLSVDVNFKSDAPKGSVKLIYLIDREFLDLGDYDDEEHKESPISLPLSETDFLNLEANNKGIKLLKYELSKDRRKLTVELSFSNTKDLKKIIGGEIEYSSNKFSYSLPKTPSFSSDQEKGIVKEIVKDHYYELSLTFPHEIKEVEPNSARKGENRIYLKQSLNSYINEGQSINIIIKW